MYAQQTYLPCLQQHCIEVSASNSTSSLACPAGGSECTDVLDQLLCGLSIEACSFGAPATPTSAYFSISPPLQSNLVRGLSQSVQSLRHSQGFPKTHSRLLYKSRLLQILPYRIKDGFNYLLIKSTFNLQSVNLGLIRYVIFSLKEFHHFITYDINTKIKTCICQIICLNAKDKIGSGV